MVNLDCKKEEIENFITDSMSRFVKEFMQPLTVGVYCSPQYGWISMNFDDQNQINDSEYNCPDFKFVEYDIIEIPEWETEFDSEKLEYKLNDVVTKFNYRSGNEKINQLFFEYLKSIVEKISMNSDLKFFVQILDSRYDQVIVCK